MGLSRQPFVGCAVLCCRCAQCMSGVLAACQRNCIAVRLAQYVLVYRLGLAATLLVVSRVDEVIFCC